MTHQGFTTKSRETKTKTGLPSCNKNHEGNVWHPMKDKEGHLMGVTGDLTTQVAMN